MLVLREIELESSSAATEFANFLAHVNVSSLELHQISTARSSSFADDEEKELTRRIVSEFKMPSVQFLTLSLVCQIEHFNAALEAGSATLKILVVRISADRNDRMARLESLTRMIRGAEKLNTLYIRIGANDRQTLPVRQLINAMEGCATITKIEETGFTRRQHNQLRRITARNRKLARLAVAAGPSSTCPTHSLPDLIVQFDQCPSGRYMLARRLPEVLSFDHLVGDQKQGFTDVANT